MRKLALLLASAALSAPAAASATAPPLVPRDLSSLGSSPRALVQLAPGARAAAEARLRAAGGHTVSAVRRVWSVPSGAAQRLVPELALAGAVRDVEPDHARFPGGHVEAGDPLVRFQWWLERVGATRAEPPGPGRPVTVIDSGVDLTHPEFAARPNTVALNQQTTVGRREFHGTAVASVVGAPANGALLVGVYPQAALNAWDASRDGRLSTADVIAGLEAASRLGPGVINLSLGGPSRNRLEEAAVLDAVARGSLVVAAVGNERESGSPLSYPASLPHVLTVASTNGLNNVSVFSSRAPGVDVAAPGEAITAALPFSFRSSGYDYVDGTSFAAPIVAGAAAWIWTARRALDATQVTQLIRTSALDLGGTGRDLDTGFGLLDIPAALTRPVPARDPFEPNDDVEQVRPGGLFAVAKPALTVPGRGRGAVRARVDAADDPHDVYRVWVPRGRTVTIAATATADVDVTPGTLLPAGLRASRRAGGLTGEVLTITNPTRGGVYAYVDVSLNRDTRALDGEYTLRLTTRAARR